MAFKKFLLPIFIFSLAAHIVSYANAYLFLINKEIESTNVVNDNNEPKILGPDRLCNVFGSVIGTFTGGGDSTSDVYQWTIIAPNGEILRETQFRSTPDISYTFGRLGPHRIILKVTRAGIPYYVEEKVIQVIKGPDILLQNSYQICENQTLSLRAIDPSSANFSGYLFEWRNSTGAIISTENELIINTPGEYQVKFFFTNTSGVTECETILTTRVEELNSFEIVASSTTLCPGGSILFETDPPTIGDWFYQKIGDPNLISIKSGEFLTLDPSQLPEPGTYEIIVKVANPKNPACSPEVKTAFQYKTLPQIEFLEAFGASGCFIADGTLRVKALTPIDVISIDGLGMAQGPFMAGETIEFQNLESGAYKLVYNLEGCGDVFGSVVPLVDPPLGLEFDIEDIQPEICTPTGKDLGSFLLKMRNLPLEGSYRILNRRGEEVVNQAVSGLDQLRIDISGGTYFFQVYGTDSCTLPKSEEFEVPGLSQVVYTIPGDLFVCQSYDLIPQTNQNLEFTLTYPSGNELTLPRNEAFTITEGGSYSIVGRLAESGEICPFLQEFTITLVEPVDFEPVLVQEDCDGNRTFEADIKGRDPNTVSFTWFNEKDEVVGNGQFLFPTSTGEFKLDVQPNNSTACPIPPVPFIIEEPVLEVEVELESTKLCEFGPRAILDLSTTFPDAITDIEWRRYDPDGTITLLGDEYENKKQVIVEIEGIYEAAVFSRIPGIGKDCELGRSSIQIDLIPEKVPFEVPSSLSICDPYQLIPNSASPLEFELTAPDGTVEIKGWNEAFELNQEGVYTILGYDPDNAGSLCPDQKTIEVTIYPPVEFEVDLLNITCDGEYTFEATISNYSLAEVDIFWKDTNGNLLSSIEFFTTTSYGNFSLEVQPKGSIPCQIDPISFEAPAPVLNLEAKIIAETLCPDQPDAALSVEADLSEISRIEWSFTDIENNQIQLTSETNKEEILATEEGTYEVRLINAFGCLLGQDQVFVLRSSDQIRPVLEESYQICPRYEIAPTLNPGNFARYEWYFQENLVSTSPTYKPNQIGNYNLIVFSSEGCAYETSFLTEEECELRVIFPNAIQPGNPDKPFLIYTNYLIDELEIWVFSKWGEIIFHCQKTELITEESTCIWEGYLDGEKIPPGSYAYRINYRNNARNISKEELGSIQVIN